MAPTWDDIRAALAARPPSTITEPVGSRAAVALVLREAGRDIELLFIRRAEHPDDPWSGHMAFPGGRAEPDDPDLETTAVRETLEEVGVDLARSGESLGPLDEIKAIARMRPVSLAITPHVFRLRERFEPRLSDEVRSVHWLPLEPLLGTALRSTMDYVHQGVSIQFPCLRFEELVIWGLTYRMFVSLQERLAALGGPPAAEAPGA